MGAERMHGDAAQCVLATVEHNCGDAARRDAGGDVEFGAGSDGEHQFQCNGNGFCSGASRRFYRLHHLRTAAAGIAAVHPVGDAGWGLDSIDLPVKLRIEVCC